MGISAGPILSEALSKLSPSLCYSDIVFQSRSPTISAVAAYQHQPQMHVWTWVAMPKLQLPFQIDIAEMLLVVLGDGEDIECLSPYWAPIASASVISVCHPHIVQNISLKH
jgi:hypothetical protein